MSSTDQVDHEETRAPFVPNDGWLDAFETQLSEAMTERVRSFARMRAFGVATTGRKVDDYYARELVQDAVADTWEGILSWDPVRVTLEAHLTRAVQFRTRNDREHAIAFPHDALGDETPRSLFAETEASDAVATGRTAETRRYADEVMACIRDQAAGDKPVLRILDAYDGGVTNKSDVLVFTKMKARTYHNARIRLGRIVRGLANRRLADKVRA